MDRLDINEWINSFNQKLKLKAFEQFSLLLCDHNSDEQQKRLLQAILFEDHRSPNAWNSYILHCIHLYPDKNLQLQRLVNKAIEMIDESLNQDNEDYFNILIESALLKNNAKDVSKQFQSLWKREYLRKRAAFFIAWSKVEKEVSGVSGAIDILQKGLLSNAEPRSSLKTQLMQINDELKQSKSNESKADASTSTKAINDEATTDAPRSSRNSALRSSKPNVSSANHASLITPSKGSLGKCVRVTKQQEPDLDEPADQHVVLTLPSKPTASNKHLPLMKPTGQALSILSEENEEDSNNQSLESTEPLQLASKHDQAPVKDITKSVSSSSNALNDNVLKFHPKFDVSVVPSKVDVDSIIADSQQYLSDSDDDDSTMLNQTKPLDALQAQAIIKEEVERKDPIKAVKFSEPVDESRKRSKDHTDIIFKANTEKKRKPSSSKLVAPTSSSHQSLDQNRLISVNGVNYYRLSVLGKGGSSTVYRVVSEDFQNIYAYKRVDLKSGNSDDLEAQFDSYVNEIKLLQTMKGSKSIIELIDAEVNKDEMYIAMIMEAGDSDLAKVLSNRRHVDGSANTSKMNPFFMRLVWQEMLEAVDDIHQHRIVHG
jgi:hypothetical protein